MKDEKIKLLDRTGQSLERDPDLWPALVISKEEIDAEIERLADLPEPDNGRRQSFFVHPRATEPGLGLAPGITLSLNVLKPGERTAPFRHNATEVNFCILGTGRTEVAGKTIRFARYDVWNHPSYTAYEHINDTSELQVRLTYSNAAFLEKLNVYAVDENPPAQSDDLEYGENKGRSDPRLQSQPVRHLPAQRRRRLADAL